MKRFGWQSLVTSSVLVAALAAGAETRPQYGGTLHVVMHTAPSSLDPVDIAQPDSFARRNLTWMMFEALVSADDAGRIHPALASSWQASPGNQRWQFRLRRDVKFHDGAALTPEIAASSLRAANPAWNVLAAADSLVIELAAADPDLPAELALARNAIVRRNADGQLSGTGPFHMVEWQPGKKLILAAEEGYWRGRPFLDKVEIEMGRNFHDQMTALELGRADLVEIAPEQSHRVSADGRRVSSSAPMELVALLFARDVQSPEDKLLREALALSVERASMRSVLLQGAGQPAGGILPTWMSGYGFVFPMEADLAGARHAREQIRNAPVWTVEYDGGDPTSRLLVERVSLNARDAGLSLQPTTAATADLRLARIPLASGNPWVSLDYVARVTGIPLPKHGDSVEDLYAAEQSMLATQRLIPLFQLPVASAASAVVKNWSVHADGSWSLADCWLGSEKP